MELVKLFKAKKGDETKLAEELAAYYNRQGRIGNHVGNAKVLTYEDGSLGILVTSVGKVDDGRQIDDIENRKSFLVYRTDGTDMTTVEDFVNNHEEAGDSVSKPYIFTIGNDLCFFIAATKTVTIADHWSDSVSDVVDDWSLEGSSEGSDKQPKNDVSANVADEDAFN